MAAASLPNKTLKEIVMGASQNAVKIKFGFNPNSPTIVVFTFRDTSDGRKSETQNASRRFRWEAC